MKATWRGRLGSAVVQVGMRCAASRQTAADCQSASVSHLGALPNFFHFTLHAASMRPPISGHAHGHPHCFGLRAPSATGRSASLHGFCGCPRSVAPFRGSSAAVDLVEAVWSHAALPRLSPIELGDVRHESSARIIGFHMPKPALFAQQNSPRLRHSCFQV